MKEKMSWKRKVGRWALSPGSFPTISLLFLFYLKFKKEIEIVAKDEPGGWG